MVNYVRIISTMEEREHSGENIHIDIEGKSPIQCVKAMYDEALHEYDMSFTDEANKLEYLEWSCIKIRFAFKFFFYHLLCVGNMLTDFVNECRVSEFSKDYLINDILYIMLSYLLNHKSKIWHYTKYSGILEDFLINASNVSKWTEENIYFHSFLIVNIDKDLIKALLLQLKELYESLIENGGD